METSDAGPIVLAFFAVGFATWLPILSGIYIQGEKINGSQLLVMSLPFTLFFVGLFMKQPDPRRWWAVFHGIVITVDTHKLVEREMKAGHSDVIKDEIADWVKNCSKSGYIKINPYRYKFRRKRDAAMFKLVWG